MGLWVATEFTAYAFDYSVYLGSAIFALSKPVREILLSLVLIFVFSFGYITYKHKLKPSIYSICLWEIAIIFLVAALFPIYNPLEYFLWLFEYGDITSSWIWYTSVSIIFISAALSILFYFILIRKNPRANSDIHGSAEFANPTEVKATGLLDTDNDNAIYVGAWQPSKDALIQYLRYTGESNVGVFAPPRSGKGGGIIIPSLLSFSGNSAVLDLRLENFYRTAGYRKSIGHTIIKLDFTCTDESAAKLNPLLEIRKGINEIRDVQNIVDIIADPDGKGRSDHWTDTANDLLVSVILHVLYVESDKSLTGVRNFMSNINLTEEQLFKMMLTTIHDPDGLCRFVDPQTEKPTRTHPLVAAGARDMLNRSEGERNGVISTLKRFLKLYRDPIIANNTRTSDFKWSDFLDPNKRTTIYINMPPPDKNRLRPLIRLVINQMLGRMTETWIPPDQKNPNAAPTLLVMDEFPQLGYLQFFENALAYTAGYGLRTLLICQDLSQLYSAYGQHQSITSSCDLLSVYAPNKLETAQYLSKMLGSKTVTREQINYSGNSTSTTLNHINTSEQDYKRELLTPDELMRLPFDESLIFKTNHKTIHGKKVMYWHDPVFNNRSKISPPLISDKSLVTHDWNYVQKHSVSESSVVKEEPMDTDDNFDLL